MRLVSSGAHPALMAPVRLEGGYRRGLERITELEDKRPDIDETGGPTRG
jgi:hypothetical protein